VNAVPLRLDILQEKHRRASAVAARRAQCRGSRREAPGLSTSRTTWPSRPDHSIVSEAIPVFFIARNHEGFWIAREADGRIGGIFLWQRSALRFAKRKAGAAGCATMHLADRFELDIQNDGNPLTASLAVVKRAIEQYVSHKFVKPIAIAEKLFAQLSSAFAEERQHRRAIEKELFGDQYKFSTNNDDDLPLVP